MAGTGIVLNTSSIVNGGEALQHKPTRDLLAWVIEELKNIRKSLGAASSGAGAGILVGASAAYDPASIADGDSQDKDITVTGAALGDFAIGSINLDVVGLGVTAQVTGTDTVTVTLLNNTGGAVDLASAIARVLVIPKAAVAMAAMTLASPTVDTPAR